MVYVDDMYALYGRMKMCHVLADSDEELHDAVQAAGVRRKWWQAPPAHDSHYDVCMSVRAKLVAAGVKQITWRQAGAMTMRRRVTGSLGDPSDALEWLASYRFEQQRRKRDGHTDGLAAGENSNPKS